MSVSTVFVRAFVDAVDQIGTPREELLEAAGIDAKRLEQVSDRVEFEEFTRLQECALDLTGDEALGLHIAERATEASFDLVAHLVAHAPTLRDAFGLCLQFQRLVIEDSQMAVRESGAIATLQCDFVLAPRPEPIDPADGARTRLLGRGLVSPSVQAVDGHDAEAIPRAWDPASSASPRGSRNRVEDADHPEPSVAAARRSLAATD